VLLFGGGDVQETEQKRILSPGGGTGPGLSRLMRVSKALDGSSEFTCWISLID
jgi:hypothetical protein